MQRSGEGHKKSCIYAALKVVKSAIASIKWKKFGTTNSLPRSDHIANLRDRWMKARLQTGNQEPNDLVEPYRRTTISAALMQSGYMEAIPH